MRMTLSPSSAAFLARTTESLQYWIDILGVPVDGLARLGQLQPTGAADEELEDPDRTPAR